MTRQVKVVIVGDTAQLEASLRRADTSLDRVGKSAQRMQRLLLGALAGGAALRGVQAVVATYTNFDTALREVGAVADVSGAKLDQLGKIARAAGLSTGVGATEATKAMGELAKAGISAADIGPALKGTLALAQAGGLATADAASAAANAMQTFGLRARDTTKIADQFANAANLTTADVGDFALAMSQGGAAAKLAGLTFSDTTLVLTELARIGIKGSDAGTSLKSAFLQLAAPTDQAAETLKKYNLTFFDHNGKVRDAADISEMLRDRLGKLSNQQQIQVLKSIAGTDGFRTLAAMMKVSGKEADSLSRQLGKAGSAAETAAAKQSGLQGSLNRLKAGAQELGIRMGERLAPYIDRAAVSLTKLAQDPAVIDRLTAVASVLGEVAGHAASAAVAVAKFAADHPEILKLAAALVAVAAGAKAISFAGQITGITKLIGLTRTYAATQAAANAAAAGGGVAAGAAAAGGAGRLAQLAGRARGAFGIAGVGLIGSQVAGSLVGGQAGKAVSTVGSSAALGAAAGTVIPGVGTAAGAIGGAIVGGIITGLKARGASQAEEAARKAAAQLQVRTERAMAAGMSSRSATRVANAQTQATGVSRDLSAARERLESLRTARSATPGGTANAFALDGAIKAQIAKINKLAPEARAAAQNVAKQVTVGLRNRSGVFDSRLLVGDLLGSLKGLAPGARAAAARTMLEFARQMETSGRAPKGTVERLVKALGDDVRTDLGPAFKAGGEKAVKELDRSFRDRRVISAANRLIKGVSEEFTGLPPVVAKTLPAATASLRTQMDRMRRIVENSTGDQKREAQKNLEALKKAYDRNLKRMADRMGMSEGEAARWARSVSASARQARSSASYVDRMSSSVRSLSRWMTTGSDDALKFKQVLAQLPALAGPLRDLASTLSDATGGMLDFTAGFEAAPKGPPAPKKPKKKRVGGILRFAGGGLVPAMLSPQEALRYPDGSWSMVPGAAVAADTVPMLLPTGTEVYTGHGQSLLAAGASRAEALREQLPHFATGGIATAVKAARGVGLRGQKLVTAVAVAGPESSYNPNARLVTGREDSRGLWQINTYAHPKWAKRNLFDPAVNAQAMREVSGSGANWQPWTGYTSGKYRSFWDRAQKAVSGTSGSLTAKGDSSTSTDRSVTYNVPRTLGASTTRARDALSASIQAGLERGSAWSRADVKAFGNPYLATLREELDQQASSYTRQVSSTIRGTKAGKSNAGGSSTGGRSQADGGVGTFDGRKVAQWIIPNLQWARKNGWGGSVTSGFRTYAEQARLYANRATNGYPVARPGTSNHEGSKYPRGAVDVSGWQSLKGLVGRAPYSKKLKWFGPGDAVHFSGTGRRRGGVIGFATGGVAGFGSGWSPAPRSKTGRALSSVLASTADRNLEALDRVLAGLATSRLEALARSLSSRVDRGGDARSNARVATALKQVGEQMGFRVGRDAAESAARLARVGSIVEDAQFGLQVRGVDENSLVGRNAMLDANGLAQTRVDRERVRLTQRIAEERERTKGLTPDARKAVLDPLREQLKEAEEASKSLGKQFTLLAADLERERPKLEAAARTAGIDLYSAQAALTSWEGDDRQALVMRRDEAQRQYIEASRRGDGEWMTQAASDLKSAADGLRGWDEQRRADILDFDAAMAALTEGDADDRAVMQRRVEDAQRRLDEALARGDEGRADATRAATDLKQWRDALNENTNAMQELKDQTQTLIDLQRQQLEETQRLSRGQDVSRDTLDRALADIVSRQVASPFIRGGGVAPAGMVSRP